MKYATYGLLAAFLASGVHGAIPDTASGWYTPSGGEFETKDSYGEVWYFDEDGEWTKAEVTVDENGKVTGFEGGVDILDAAFPAYQAMLSALQAETIAKQNTERIQTIGQNLAAWKAELDKTKEDVSNIQSEPGVDFKDSDASVKFTEGNGIGSGHMVAVFNGSFSGVGVDDASIVSNSNGKIGLKGFESLRARDSGQFPFFDGEELDWFSLPSLFDNASVSAQTQSGLNDWVKAKGIQLAGWDAPTTGVHECSPTLADMLKDKAPSGSDEKSSHYVLTRYNNSGTPVLHYTKIGDLADVGTAIKFIGTDSNYKTVGGPSSTTNTVTFASAEDSNVEVTVGGTDGAVTITIGVYYK